MIIRSHDLVHDKDGGNGYHGRCAHCRVPLVTDLGYCSWEGVECIDREIENYSDIPKEIISYSRFFGMHWDRSAKKFKKPYSEVEYTIDEINLILQKINK
jgi:hypothetical protein